MLHTGMQQRDLHYRLLESQGGVLLVGTLKCISYIIPANVSERSRSKGPVLRYLLALEEENAGIYFAHAMSCHATPMARHESLFCARTLLL